MASIAVSFPASGASDDAAGDIAWANPSNITTSNGSLPSTTGFATAALTAASPESEYLVATYASPVIRTDAMGTAGAIESVTGIPTGATITGIEVVVEASPDSDTGTVSEKEVRLVIGGVIQTSGDDKSTGAALASDDDHGDYENLFKTYGSDTDLWGLTITPTDINAGTFGVALRYTGDGANDITACVDTVMVRVYYTVPTFNAAIRHNGGETTRQAPWVWSMHAGDCELSTYSQEACVYMWELLEFPDGFDPGTFTDPRRGVPPEFATVSARRKFGLAAAWELTHPGDYKARLTLIAPDGSQRDTAEVTTTVVASTRTVRYVDGNATGANDGTSLADAWTSIADAYTWIDSNPSGFILEIEGGQTYSHTAARTMANVANAVFRTRAGSGDRAKITFSAASTSNIWGFTSSANNVILRDLCFHKPTNAAGTRGPTFSSTNDRNLAVINCTGENLGSFIEWGTFKRWNVYVAGCDGGDTHRYGAGFFGGGTCLVVEHNTFTSRGSNGAEGITRISNWELFTLAYNTFDQDGDGSLRQSVRVPSSRGILFHNRYTGCHGLTLGNGQPGMGGFHTIRSDGDDFDTPLTATTGSIVLASNTETAGVLVVNPINTGGREFYAGGVGGSRDHVVRHAMRVGDATDNLIYLGNSVTGVAGGAQRVSLTNSIFVLTNPETAFTGDMWNNGPNDSPMKEAGGNIHPLNNDGSTSRDVATYNNDGKTLAEWNALSTVGTDMLSRLPATYLGEDTYWALTDYSYTGTVATATSSTVFTLDAAASDLDDYYNGATVTIGSDTGIVQDYVGSTRQITLVAALAGGTPSVATAVTVARDFSTERAIGKSSLSHGAVLDYRGVFRDLSGDDTSPGPTGVETLPDAPANVEVTSLGTTATITWDAVDDDETYRIWRSTTSGGPYVLAGEVDADETLTFDDPDLTVGTEYFWVVTVVDSAFNESPESDEVSATISNSVTYSTAGEHTFIAPITGLISVQSTGGSGSGGSKAGGITTAASAGGGGGGEFAFGQVAVTQGESYTATVGAGGAQVAGNNDGNAGGDSFFVGDDSAEVRAKGGGGGGTDGTGGAGGTGGTGDTLHAGGAGGAGAFEGGGGGGAAGGPNGDGQDGFDGDDPTYPRRGGIGVDGAGSGGLGANSNLGFAGTAPGGGGGGGRGNFSSAGNGGAGRPGQLILSWVEAETDVELLEVRDAGGNSFSPLGRDGETVHLGDVTQGTDGTRTFRIYNIGDVTLTLSTGGQSIDGDAAFEVTEPPSFPPSTVELVTGEATTFTPVVLDTSTIGDGYSFTLSVAHDGDDTPLDITFTYNVVAAPEPEVPPSGRPFVTIETLTILNLI